MINKTHRHTVGEQHHEQENCRRYSQTKPDSEDTAINERKEYKPHYYPGAKGKDNPLLPRNFAGNKMVGLTEHESPDHGSINEQEQPRDARVNIHTRQPGYLRLPIELRDQQPGRG